MDLLESIGAIHRFRDPLYGFIWLTKAEVDIIDTLMFQRLRRIHQLALTKYVYPTAEHSRFVHSLGVLHVATDIFTNLIKDNQSRELLIGSTDEKEAEKYLKILRFAALLHDVGHLPFSHATEEALLPQGISHEDVSCYLIVKHRPISSIIKREGVPPEVVASLLDLPRKKYSILKEIISGQFDADRADYLLRDSYSCGVKYGEYDYSRYIQSFKLSSSGQTDVRLNISEKNVFVLESFLLARLHYNLQVPFHRTRAGYDIALERYIADLKSRDKIEDFVITGDDGKISEFDEEFFEFFDDYSLFTYIKEDYRKNNKWAPLLMRKGHLVPVFDVHKCKTEDESKYKRFIKALKKENFVEGEDFFRREKPISFSGFIKPPQREYQRDGVVMDKQVDVIDSNGEVICDIIDYSKVIHQLVEPNEIYRVFVTQEKKAEADEILKGLLSEIKDEAVV